MDSDSEAHGRPDDEGRDPFQQDVKKSDSFDPIDELVDDFGAGAMVLAQLATQV